MPVPLALAVHIRKLSISYRCETNHLVMVRQRRSEVQMRQLIMRAPVIRIHYLTGFINSVVSSGTVQHTTVCLDKVIEKLARS